MKQAVSNRLRIHLFGEFQAIYNEQPLTGLHADRPQSLLAFLLLHRGVPRQRRHLAFSLWPDSPEGQARTNLRNLLHSLRQMIPDADNYILADSTTIQWQCQSDYDLDVASFEAALQEARQADDLAVICSSLETAVTLYQGDLLPGNYDDWIIPIREEFRQQYLAALRQLITLLEEQQDFQTAARYCQRLIHQDPFDESATVLLMRQLALSGERASVRRTYQTLVATLQRELGVEPALATQEAYNQLLRLQPTSPTAVDLPSNWNRHPLPIPATHFIGRETEVTEIVQRLLSPNCRLLTILGAGGIGKTRLSLQVAAAMQDDFADGVLFVPLASLSDPHLLIPTIARQLDLREGGGQPILQMLISTLQEKHLLLVLDNFEQIITAAPLVAELLAAAPRLKVLITSRILPRLQGNYEYLLPPLSLPDQIQAASFQELKHAEAVQLFVERAQATFTGFTLTADNAPIVARICQHLDGIPLAIELAAARIKLLPPHALLARLDNRLKVLVDGPKDMPARQQTLRNTIDWSYSLLNPMEQALFSRLAIFVGGFTLETVEAICHLSNFPDPDSSKQNSTDAWDILEGLTSLLNKSLIIVQNTSSGQVRFRMLETIREYATERLEESGQLETLQLQHAHYFASQLEQIGENLHFYGGHHLDWAETEHDNIRTMLAWILTQPDHLETGLRMVGILYWFWYQRGYLSEGQTWCQHFMAHIRQNLRTMGWALFLMGSGSLALWRGDLDEAAQQMQESIAIFRELGDNRRLGMALLGWGVLSLYQGNTDEAQAIFEETLAIGQPPDLWWIKADALLNLGNVAAAHGDYVNARTCLEQASILAKDKNEVWLRANVLNNLGELARMEGNYDLARHNYEESQALFTRMEAKSDVARSLHSLGYVSQHQGDLKRAEHYFRKSLDLFNELGNKRGMAECLAGLAGLLAVQSKYQQAARLLGAAETQIKNSGALWWPADQVEVDRNLHLIQTALDQETFEANWSNGQTMSLPQALAEVSLPCIPYG